MLAISNLNERRPTWEHVQHTLQNISFPGNSVEEYTAAVINISYLNPGARLPTRTDFIFRFRPQDSPASPSGVIRLPNAETIFKYTLTSYSGIKPRHSAPQNAETIVVKPPNAETIVVLPEYRSGLGPLEYTARPLGVSDRLNLRYINLNSSQFKFLTEKVFRSSALHAKGGWKLILTFSIRRGAVRLL
ncbi:hypothetical protein DFH09DRAFT_1081967 [Mycena vulgaris]|nr:hypothetical protein DFH09DRAFT_1081967 [Mycena vulgaris]